EVVGGDEVDGVDDRSLPVVLGIPRADVSLELDAGHLADRVLVHLDTAGLPVVNTVEAGGFEEGDGERRPQVLQGRYVGMAKDLFRDRPQTGEEVETVLPFCEPLERRLLEATDLLGGEQRSAHAI